MLPDVFALDLVLRHPVQRGGDLGDGIAEPAVVEIDLLLVACPPEVEVPRLVGEYPTQSRRHGVGLGREVAGCLVPLPVTVGEHGKDPVDGPVGLPVLDLPAYPFGLRRQRRGEQQEPLGVVEGLDDGTPQVRIYRQAGLVAEDLQGPPPEPRLGQFLERLLQRGRELSVGRVRVGDEAVVTHVLTGYSRCPRTGTPDPSLT